MSKRGLHNAQDPRNNPTGEMMRGSTETTQSNQPEASGPTDPRRGALSTTRLVAILALFPAVPTFLASTLALGIFYLSPERFNAWISRLPGDTMIRTVLIFAPAIMFAVVVLAVLYAVGGSRPRVEAASQQVDESVAVADRAYLVQQIAQRVLFVSLPVFLMVVFVRVVAFLAPVRFAALIEPLPATRLLDALLDVAPILSLLVVLLCMGLALGLRARRANQTKGATRPFISPDSHALRLAVFAVLLASVPILGLSMMALGMYYLRPGSFGELLLRLPEGTVLRLGMLFVPASLFLIVGLAFLYLVGQASQGAQRSRLGEEKLHAGLTWILVAGLLLAGTTVLGLFGGGLFFLLR